MTTPGTTPSTKSEATKKAPTKVLATKVLARFTAAGKSGDPGQKFADPTPLPGLFVIFRAAPASADSTSGKIARSTWSPYREAPAPSNLPAPLVDGVPSTQWALGRCDERGYLGAVEAMGPNPSDAYKLLRKGKYEMVLVHHPSVAVARSYLQSLTFNASGIPIQVLEVSDEGVVQVRLDPEGFVPAGPKAYGGFTLFEGMPLRGVEVVREGVKKLQDDLGKLRFIVGCINAGSPYEHVKVATPLKGEAAAEPVAGVFSAQTLSAVLGFQRAAKGGSLWKLSKAPSDSWDWTRVESAGGQPVPHAVAKPPHEADGVVDESTANAIAEAIGARLRRPGEVLVEVHSYPPTTAVAPPFPPESKGKCWLSEPAALAYNAWDQLTIALGAPFGVSFGHSFRSVFDALACCNKGKAVRSPHKTGRAMDLSLNSGDGTYRAGTKAFPAAVIREVVGEDVRWRLFLPAAHPATPTDESVAALRQALSAAAKRGATEAAFAGLREPAARLLGELEHPETFFSTYYRPLIAPWRYEPTPEGGYEELERAPLPLGQSWLDITGVASLVHLFGINAVGGWNGAREVAMEARVVARPAGRDRRVPGLLAEARANEAEAARDLAEQARKLEGDAEALAHLPKLESRAVTITRGARAGVGPATVPLADVHLEAMALWYEELQKLAKESVDGLKVIAPAIQVTLPARPDPACVSRAQALLRTLGAQEIHGTHVDVEVATGEAWAARLAELHAALVAPSTLDDGSVGTTAPDPARYVISLTPVFASGESGPTTLGPDDVVSVKVDYQRCQEWWHFQLEGTKRAQWEANMARIGWEVECLQRGPIASLHGQSGAGYPPGQ